MRVFRMHPEFSSDPNVEDQGSHSHWVDDGTALLNLPHHKTGSVINEWPKNLVFRIGHRRMDADVLYNPSGFICTPRFREDISKLCGSDVEWLPVTVETLGEMFVFHPVRTAELGPKAEFRQHAPGDNIVEIRRYDFATDVLPTCFMIPQPPESPAGRARFAASGILVTDVFRNRMWKYRGIDFARVFDSEAKSNAS